MKVTSLCAQNIWDVRYEVKLLDKVKYGLFHLLTPKLLYITNKKRPDIEPDMALLTPRVVKSNVGDWNKLKKCISYLNQTVDGVSIIGVSNITGFFTWVDASYDVHPNMCSQTRGLISLGYGMLHC